MLNSNKSKLLTDLDMDPYIILAKHRARGVNRNKSNRYRLLIHATIKQEQLILAQGEDSKKGQLIYLTQRVVFK